MIFIIISGVNSFYILFFVKDIRVFRKLIFLNLLSV